MGVERDKIVGADPPVTNGGSGSCIRGTDPRNNTRVIGTAEDSVVIVSDSATGKNRSG